MQFKILNQYIYNKNSKQIQNKFKITFWRSFTQLHTKLHDSLHKYYPCYDFVR